jgi:hypothetical protein
MALFIDKRKIKYVFLSWELSLLDTFGVNFPFITRLYRLCSNVQQVQSGIFDQVILNCVFQFGYYGITVFLN